MIAFFVLADFLKSINSIGIGLKKRIQEAEERY